MNWFQQTPPLRAQELWGRESKECEGQRGLNDSKETVSFRHNRTDAEMNPQTVA